LKSNLAARKKIKISVPASLCDKTNKTL